MPRIRQVPLSEVEDKPVLDWYTRIFGDKDPVAEPGTVTGSPGNWWPVFANAPEVLKDQGSTFLLYPELSLNPQLREMCQTRAGWASRSKFVFSQHAKSCRALGMADEKIEAIASWQVSDLFSPLERAALAFTDSVALDSGRVSDEVFALLQASLTDRQLVELTWLAAEWTKQGAMANALRLEFDDEPEHVGEVAGEGTPWSTPGGFG
jgi:alkylhydroperoxidase family enzyme